MGVGEGVGVETVGVGDGVGEDTVTGGAVVIVSATDAATVLPTRFAVNATVDCFTICTGSGNDLNAFVWFLPGQ